MKMVNIALLKLKEEEIKTYSRIATIVYWKRERISSKIFGVLVILSGLSFILAVLFNTGTGTGSTIEFLPFYILLALMGLVIYRSTTKNFDSVMEKYEKQLKKMIKKAKKKF